MKKIFCTILEAAAILAGLALPVFLSWLIGSSIDLIPSWLRFAGPAVCVLFLAVWSNAVIDAMPE